MNKSYDVKSYPKLYSDLLNLGLDQKVIESVSYNLMRIYQGNTDVYRTPICKKFGEDRILSDLDEVFNANKFKLNSVLIRLEEDNKAKFGARSIAIPWSERVGKFSETFEPEDCDISYLDIRPTSNKGILRPISLSSSLGLLKNDTNSGLPFYTRKGKVKQRAYDEFGELINRRYPCILFTRTQEQGKTRDVWGYPIADTLNETRYYTPLLEHQRKLDYRSALISPDAVSRSLTNIISRCQMRYDYIIISIDFSAYDRKVKATLQKLAFNYIKDLYQSRYADELDYISNRFNTIGIVTPTGIYNKPHGVPSGSTFTNEVDSIVQEILSNASGYVRYGDFQIQGDDGVYLIPADKIENFYSIFRRAGLSINEEKSSLSRDYAIYLQCLYHKDYYKDGIIGGIYPIYRALNRILFQERWSNFEDFGISGKDYYSIRTISILENCKYHPLFKELVQVILKYDKYSLDPSDQGISNYIKMIKESQGAGEFLNQQYGSKVSGIKSFATYKLIRELS